MKERNEWWIATILLAALLIIKEVNIINGQNITSEDKLSTKKAGILHNLLYLYDHYHY